MTPTTATRVHLVERAAALLARPAQAFTAPPLQEPLAPAPPLIRRAAPLVTLTALHAAGLIVAPRAAGHSRALEEIAMVQHQVLRSVDEAQNRRGSLGRIILIASALPDEGKSFIALNLAANIASRALRPVLLIDADRRQGSITSLLGADDLQGLHELIGRPDAKAAELIMGTELEGLSVLPHGAAHPDEPMLPQGSTAAAAVLRLAASMPDHIIVLDPPPCLSTSDCTALAAIAGQVVLVVDAERTSRGEVEAALDVLEACPTLQLVLNRMRVTAEATFGAHGGYGGPN